MAERDDDKDAWLARPRTIRLLWIVFLAVVAATLVADLFLPHESHVGFEGTFGFGAWFGFAACVVLVLGSRLLGRVLKRPEDYYDRRPGVPGSRRSADGTGDHEGGAVR